MKRLFLGLMVLTLFSGTGRAQVALVIGGFDAARGGQASLRDSSRLAGLRSAIAAAFPGTTFTATSSLTPGYLGTVNVLFISSAAGDASATTALTPAEQSALSGFGGAGGGSLIFVDNDTFAGPGTPAVNNSLLTPFGLHATGTLSGFQTANVTDPAYPVVNGPFGSFSSYRTDFPGWFDNSGPSHPFAVLAANGQTELSAIAPGMLGLGSGGSVFSGDTTLLFDTVRTSADTTMFLNAIAFVSVPEPSALALVGIGVAGMSGYTWRRKNCPANA